MILEKDVVDDKDFISVSCLIGTKVYETGYCFQN